MDQDNNPPGTALSEILVSLGQQTTYLSIAVGVMLDQLKTSSPVIHQQIKERLEPLLKNAANALPPVGRAIGTLELLQIAINERPGEGDAEK